SLPSATPKLAVLLSDPERRVRRAALKALGRIGPEARAALPAILATTRDQSAYVRQAAVLTLGDLDQLNENVLASLRRALRDEDWRVRLNAVKSLAILDAAATAEFAVPVLVAVLERETGADQRGKNQFQKQIEQHRDIRLRSDAISYTQWFGADAAAAVPPLTAILRTDDFFQVGRAANVLTSIGSPARSAIPNLLSVALEKPRDRSFIIGSSYFGKPEYAQGEAARALVDLAKNGAAIVDLLVPRLRSSDPTIRGNAANLISRIGISHAAAIPILIDMAANDADFTVRIDAVDALGAMGADALDSVPLLIAILEDSRIAQPVGIRRYIKSSAAVALGKIGPEAEAAIPALSAQLKDNRSRHLAARAILQIGNPEESFPLLLQMHANDDERVRANAIAAIGSIGTRAAPAVPDLIKLLQDPSEIVRTSAVRSLGRMGPVAAPAIPPLLALEAVATDDMRSTILQALGLIGVRSPEVMAMVLTVLNEEKGNSAAAAAGALAKLGPTANAIPGLIRLLEGASSSGSAAKALGLLGPLAEDAVPALIASLRSGINMLGNNAIIALGEIGPSAIASVPRLNDLLRIAREYPTPAWQNRRNIIEKSLRQIRGS
ncbi:MAG: HEAT repeat domain-containing protein, partial [Alphaproteobacteria bacterium]|nr:HEAT repeat domain-containing protein [Alphaproteobacteria bacterium]